MGKNNQFAELFLETPHRVSETIRELQRVAVTTEERIQQRIRSSVRIVIASALFCISGLVSFGINVGTALAAHKGSHAAEDHRSAHRKAKHHRRHWNHLSSLHEIDRTNISEASLIAHKKGVTGKASWYGGKFQHRKTASGGKFDTHSMTAAHRTLPFGTKVRVTNTDNNKSCVVEITDRGPFVGSRVIDLSYAAASELGFANLGTANVHIEVIGSLAGQLESSLGSVEHDPLLVAKNR